MKLLTKALYFKADKTLTAYAEEARSFGRIKA